jgi:hypothetical protein
MKVPAAPGIRPVRTGKNKSRPQVYRAGAKRKTVPCRSTGPCPQGKGLPIILLFCRGAPDPAAPPLIPHRQGERELVRAGRASVKTRDSYA